MRPLGHNEGTAPLERSQPEPTSRDSSWRKGAKPHAELSAGPGPRSGPAEHGGEATPPAERPDGAPRRGLAPEAHCARPDRRHGVEWGFGGFPLRESTAGEAGMPSPPFDPAHHGRGRRGEPRMGEGGGACEHGCERGSGPLFGPLRLQPRSTMRRDRLRCLRRPDRGCIEPA